MDPGGNAAVHPEGVADARIAVGHEGHDALAEADGGGAVRAALGADLVPEILTVQVGMDDGQLGGVGHTGVGQVEGLGAVVDLPGDGEGVILPGQESQGASRLGGNGRAHGQTGDGGLPRLVGIRLTREVGQGRYGGGKLLPYGGHAGNESVGVVVEVVGQLSQAAVSRLTRQVLVVHARQGQGAGRQAQGGHVAAADHHVADLGGVGENAGEDGAVKHGSRHVLVQESHCVGKLLGGGVQVDGQVGIPRGLHPQANAGVGVEADPLFGQLGNRVLPCRQAHEGVVEATGVEQLVLVQSAQVKEQTGHDHTVGTRDIGEGLGLAPADLDGLLGHVANVGGSIDIGRGEVRNGGLGLGGVGGGEVLVEGGHLGLQGGVASLGGVDAGSLGLKAGVHLDPLLLGEGTGGDALGQAPVVGVQDILLDQMLEVALVGGHSLPESGQVVGGRGVVELHLGADEGLHNAEARLHGQGCTAAIRLVAVHQVADALGGDALFADVGQGIQDGLTEALGALGIGFAQGEVEHGLAVVTLAGHAEVLAHAGIQHGLGQGRLGVLCQVA